MPGAKVYHNTLYAEMHRYQWRHNCNFLVLTFAFKFGHNNNRVHPIKSPWTVLEKRKHGRIQGLPIFFGYPLLSQEQEKLRMSNLASSPVHSEGPSEQKPIVNFREKWVWVYPGTAHFFRVPPIISETGKTTDFKFGQYIQRVHPNKSPWKIFKKRKRRNI